MSSTKKQYDIQVVYNIALNYLLLQTFMHRYILQSPEPAFFATSVLVTNVVEILEVRVQIALAVHEVRAQLPVWRPLAMPYWPY